VFPRSSECFRGIKGTPSAGVLLGWARTLLLGSQVMKPNVEGVHLIYGDARDIPCWAGRSMDALVLRDDREVVRRRRAGCL